ncbi:MAG: hypothetical protein R2856_10860 [Caldilineaceae bacterium]
MKQLTIRGIDSRLDHFLKQEAERRGQSVNRYVLSILRVAAGEERDAQPQCVSMISTILQAHGRRQSMPSSSRIWPGEVLTRNYGNDKHSA